MQGPLLYAFFSATSTYRQDHVERISGILSTVSKDNGRTIRCRTIQLYLYSGLGSTRVALLLKEGKVRRLKNIDNFCFEVDIWIIVGATYSHRGSLKSSQKDIFNALVFEHEFSSLQLGDSGMCLCTSCVVTLDGDEKYIADSDALEQVNFFNKSIKATANTARIILEMQLKIDTLANVVEAFLDRFIE